MALRVFTDIPWIRYKGLLTPGEYFTLEELRPDIPLQVTETWEEVIDRVIAEGP